MNPPQAYMYNYVKFKNKIKLKKNNDLCPLEFSALYFY